MYAFNSFIIHLSPVKVKYLYPGLGITNSRNSSMYFMAFMKPGFTYISFSCSFAGYGWVSMCFFSSSFSVFNRLIKSSTGCPFLYASIAVSSTSNNSWYACKSHCLFFDTNIIKNQRPQHVLLPSQYPPWPLPNRYRFRTHR